MSFSRKALICLALAACAPSAPATDISRDEPIVEPEPAAMPGVTSTPAALASASAPVVNRDARDCSIEFRERLESGGPAGRIEGVPCLEREHQDVCLKRAESVVKRGAGERIVGLMSVVSWANFEADVVVDGVVEHWLGADTDEISKRADARAKAGSSVKISKTVATKTGKRQALLLISEMRPLAPSTKTTARIEWRPKQAMEAADASEAVKRLAASLDVKIIAAAPLDTRDGIRVTLECGG
jgi:hypothetical protein